MSATRTNLNDSPLAAAAERLYDAEVALSVARGSGVDDWVKAAADRLHEALAEYLSLAEPTAVMIVSPTSPIRRLERSVPV